MRTNWLLWLLTISSPTWCYAQIKSSVTETPCSFGRGATKEDNVMFGRLAAAIEDVGGGYYAEAQRRYSRILRDIEKRDYDPCLRWMVYDGYGELLVTSRKRDKAIAILNRAVELAKNLSAKEQEESARHMEAAQKLH